MPEESSPSRHPTPHLDASMSKLSINSSNSTSEDWDRSASDLRVESEPPKTPSRPRIMVLNGIDQDNDGTPGGAKGRKSLSDLLRLHAEKGKDLQLSEEDEQRLSEELGRWINSDSSPYEPEPDDDFFSRPSKDDSSLGVSKASKATDVTGRPRGQSESILLPNRSGSRPGSSSGERNT
ncbi:hypothetical protein BU17DRAFT_58624 [Hysterangium stoloniferum]|nr:hypothetical protein BU17DRAFT_58624 [Hysterangium stoloniferum]